MIKGCNFPCSISCCSETASKSDFPKSSKSNRENKPNSNKIQINTQMNSKLNNFGLVGQILNLQEFRNLNGLKRSSDAKDMGFGRNLNWKPSTRCSRKHLRPGQSKMATTTAVGSGCDHTSSSILTTSECTSRCALTPSSLWYHPSSEQRRRSPLSVKSEPLSPSI